MRAFISFGRYIYLAGVSIALSGCINSVEGTCEVDIDDFSKRVECINAGYFPASRKNDYKDGGAELYNRVMLCANKLEGMIKKGEISDYDAWYLFLSNYPRLGDYSGHAKSKNECASQDSLNELAERKRYIEDARRLKMEKNTIWREGEKMVAPAGVEPAHPFPDSRF